MLRAGALLAAIAASLALATPANAALDAADFAVDHAGAVDNKTVDVVFNDSLALDLQQMLVANPNVLKARDVKEMISLAKAEPDKLIFRELRNTLAQRLRQQQLQSQTLFQTNHTILCHERIHTRLEQSDRSHNANADDPERQQQIASEMEHAIDHCQDDAYKQKEPSSPMKDWIESCMVSKTLLFQLRH